MALMWGLFRGFCLKDVSSRQSSVAGSCSLCEFNIIPRLSTRAVSWDRGGEGTYKGCPYGWIMRRPHGGRAPTRGAPTVDNEGAHTGGEGTHKGGAYGWIMRGPHGGRAPTRGAPTVDNEGAHTGGEGTHKGGPYGWIMRRPHGGEGAHEGCPYGWIMRAPTRGEE